jgi:diaminopropionate ammonia-lyase
MPGYQHTPLVEFPDLAREFNLGRLFVKDESARLGLPAFKMLGASWAVAQAVGARLGTDPRTLDQLLSLNGQLHDITLVTATDGNHGRAVARMARILGTCASVFVPAAVDPMAASLIEGEGADVTTCPASYDETVRTARMFAEAQLGAVLVQDTSWPGYEVIPQWIVDGYSTLFREIDNQLAARRAAPAGLVAVPVGVGSLAQAAVTYHRSTPGEPSSLLAVEPEAAACVLASLTSGAPVSLETGRTKMDGLNCGTPSRIAWPFIAGGLDAAVRVSDDQAARSASRLASGGVPAGPCGGASLAGLTSALSGPQAGHRRRDLGLTPSSTVVLLSTDGTVNGL